MRVSRLCAVFAAGLLGNVVAASAQITPTSTPTPTTAPVTTVAPTNPDDVVRCHSEPTIGSNLTKRTCHTVAEWKQIHDAAQGQMDDMTRRNRLGGPG